MMTPRCLLTLLLMVVVLIACADCLPQRSNAGEKVLEIPTDGGVKTLQQVLLEKKSEEEKNEEDYDDAIEVAVAAQNLDHFKSERVRSPDASDTSNVRTLQGDPKPTFVNVRSTSPVRLNLSPSSKLHGAPGETVLIEFLLTNLGPRHYFNVLARESSAPPINPDSVNFPQAQTTFLVSVSELKPVVDQNETRSIVMTIRVPYEAYPGMRRLITLELQPQGNNVAGPENMLARRLYFTVANEDPNIDDKSPPTCATETTFESHCGPFQQLGVCETKSWSATFTITDADSGLRSIVERPQVSYNNDPRNAFYSHDNFVIGETAKAVVVYGGSCCPGRGGEIDLTVTDVAGNVGTCHAGSVVDTSDDHPDNFSKAGPSTTAVIIISVVVAVLLLLLIGAGVAIVVIRRRREAELAEMRESPQAR